MLLALPLKVVDKPGIHGWHWEVAVTYADCLADVCLHGSTSNIQKVALVGANKDTTLIHKVVSVQNKAMKSAGLLDLVYFTASQETHDRGEKIKVVLQSILTVLSNP